MRVEGGITAYADPTRLEQIVWNLVSNAVKFTPEGGVIDVSATADGEFARLAVSDSGVGIEPHLLDQVFDMFHQAHRGIGRSQGGLGIGLALVKRLAEMQGGSARAASQGLGKGATFSVSLPLFEGHAAKVDPGARTLRDFAGLRVLWVDDDESTLQAFSEVLTMEGAKVAAVVDADAALQAASGQTFDVVLSDIAMPGRDGYDLISELRRQAGTLNAVAIAVTGLGREDDRKRAIAAGFDAHLSKPLELETLLAAINHLYAHRL